MDKFVMKKGWIPIEFLLAFYSSYGAVLYRLRDIASYWSKIAKFLCGYLARIYGYGYPTQPRRNFEIFDRLLIKLEWLGYRVVKKLWRYVKPLSRVSVVLRRDKMAGFWGHSVGDETIVWWCRYDTIMVWHNACDGQTDRQKCGSTCRVLHWRHEVMKSGTRITVSFMYVRI